MQPTITTTSLEEPETTVGILSDSEKNDKDGVQKIHPGDYEHISFDDVHKEDPYNAEIVDAYEALRSHNESEFMKRIRKWEKRMGFLTPLRWTNIIALAILHVLGFAAIVYAVRAFEFSKWKTVLFLHCWMYAALFGITAGIHRYYTHRTFKAKWPLQVILAVCYTLSGQNKIYDWVRDHRVHHKFSDTSADPHNINRGFFFSHVGWLMMKKHLDVIREGRKIDMSDIENDPIVKFQTKYYVPLQILLCIVLPVMIPTLGWGESPFYALCVQTVYLFLQFQSTWSINSFAHTFGTRPYDKNIKPTNNSALIFITLGEGYHNYHHAFPWDYRASDLYLFNMTTVILDFFAKVGWAYDLKEASPSLVQAVVENRGSRDKFK